jgi:hypothetical protein
VFSDDVLAFAESPDGSGLVAVPAYPFIKLWPDALASAGLDPDGVPPIFPRSKKRRFNAESGFSSEPERLVSLYVLGSGERVGISDLSPHDSFAELVHHTYAARALEDCGPQPWHLELVARVIESSNIHRLTFPKDRSGGVSAVLQAVEHELGA